MDAPLAGLLVADLTQNVAGPYCTQILGDMGAQVVKVERPGRGDDARAWAPPYWGRESASFMSVNRNKRSLAVDMKAPEGRAILERLIARADVLVQSLRAGAIEELGLGWDDARRINPRLVYCSITAFGTDGPLADRPGYDPLMQAYGGIMSVTGHRGQPPARVPVSLVDMGTGMWAVTAILGALRERDRTGRGAHVTTALFDTAIACMTFQMSNYLATGEVPEPQGSGTPMIAPYEAFPSRDAWVMIAAASDALFVRTCAGARGSPRSRRPALRDESRRASPTARALRGAGGGDADAHDRRAARAAPEGGRADRAHPDARPGRGPAADRGERHAHRRQASARRRLSRRSGCPSAGTASGPASRACRRSSASTRPRCWRSWATTTPPSRSSPRAMSSSYKTLNVTRSADGFVVTVELYRPEALNAMNTAMGEELLRCFDAVHVGHGGARRRLHRRRREGLLRGRRPQGARGHDRRGLARPASDLRAGRGARAPLPRAGDRGGGGLRDGRRLRAGRALRPDRRERERGVRGARGHARHLPRHRRHPAPAAHHRRAARQGDDLHRTPRGRAGGQGPRARESSRAAGPGARQGARDRGDHRRQWAHRGAPGEEGHQLGQRDRSRDRDGAGHRGVQQYGDDRGPPGRRARVQREAQAPVQGASSEPGR